MNALSKCDPQMERFSVLKRMANASVSVREVSAQEALWILIHGMPMYGKSRNILKVKTGRHNKRYYRVQSSQCKHEIEILTQKGFQSDESEGEVEFIPRLENMERVYMQRPDFAPFDKMSYKCFCERFELSDPSSSKQRLKRWKLIGEENYIKERSSIQAGRKSPRLKTDPADPDYCFSELF